jgi:hypothetical protein
MSSVPSLVMEDVATMPKDLRPRRQALCFRKIIWDYTDDDGGGEGLELECQCGFRYLAVGKDTECPCCGESTKFTFVDR